ncbi:inositol-tetrakisphosphate 1-kinase [Pelomyxa schiedti]|nr:inositol-tetrakisphosphate 1-kinase [Pelomyxa schiedti]
MKRRQVTIAFYVSPAKYAKLGWPPIESLALPANISKLHLVESAAALGRLSSEAELDVAVVKVTELLAEARSGDASAAAEVAALEGFFAEHPGILQIDRISLQRQLAHRTFIAQTLAALDDVVTTACPSLFRPDPNTNTTTTTTPPPGTVPATPRIFMRSPRCFSLESNDALARSAEVAAMDFPVMCKRDLACGCLDSHVMEIVLSKEALPMVSTKAPLLVQEYINHDSVLTKVFAIGPHVFTQTRPSLPNFSNTAIGTGTEGGTQPLAPLLFDNTRPAAPQVEEWRASPAARCMLPDSKGNAALQQALPRAIEVMAQQLSKILGGAALFGFDVVCDSAVSRAAVIDVNYFPSYKVLTASQFLENLADFALTQLEERNL